MGISDRARITRVAFVAGVMAAGLGLGGCIASPTYGTDKTANEQLLEDLSGMLALTPKKGVRIDYKPRPELVTPETTAVLPPPQDDVTTASNPAWPESPEERLARVRAEATENQNNPFYRPNVINDLSGKSTANDDPLLADMSDKERSEEAKRRRNLQLQGNPNSRQYLSEPPLVYRQPAETAPAGELGEPEWKKERAARRDSRTAAMTTPQRTSRSPVASNF